MTEPPLTELEKLRRLVIVLQSTALNFGYYRGAMTTLRPGPESPFVDIHRRIANNFLDIGVFEWCKLFAEREKQHWGRSMPAANLPDFEAGLYSLAGTDKAGWEDYCGEFLTYRDKFLGHLDDKRVMNIPVLDNAVSALHYYVLQLRKHHPLAYSIAVAEFDMTVFVVKADADARDYLTPLSFTFSRCCLAPWLPF